MSTCYFIGAGPGDPDFLTLRGARLLAGCRTVFALTPFETTFAPLLDGKEILVPFDFRFAELLEQVEARLRVGDVAFLVPGDLTFYSPFQALIDALEERAVAVPGVGTANAAAACLKRTLDLPGACNRAIIASPRLLAEEPGAPSLRELAAPGATLLLYMNNLPLPELVAELRAGYGRSVPIAILHRLCLPGQVVLTGTLDDVVAKAGGRDFFELAGPKRRAALTLVIVGETLTTHIDGGWWDQKWENDWQFRE